MLIDERENKRSYPRLDYHSQLRYQIRGGLEFENALTSDIGSGGLKFTCSRFIPTQSPLMLEFSLLKRTLHPVGRVAWSRAVPHSDLNQTGVQFLEFDPAEKSYLDDFLNMQLNA